MGEERDRHDRRHKFRYSEVDRSRAEEESAPDAVKVLAGVGVMVIAIAVCVILLR